MSMMCSGNNPYSTVCKCLHDCCRIYSPKSGNKAKERRHIKRKERQDFKREMKFYY